MDNRSARKLLPLVNDPDHYAILKDHVENRIEILRSYLETQTDHLVIVSYQGSISELRKLLTLREQAIQESKRGSV